MKILVVDSDALFPRLLKTKLENWGHQAHIEHDGLAAHDLIRKEPFRMVILDWDLPGMNGPELCAAIRKMQRARYTYILFYTAKSDKESVLACLRAGADDYLIKPLNTIELRLRIKNGKRLLNMEDELREGAGEDQATGVVNEASLRHFFRVVLAESRRTETRGSLIYITVNNYADIFENSGYSPAENLMKQMAEMMGRTVRQSDLVSRTSEASFCIMLQNTFWDRCRPVADKIWNQAANLTVYVDEASFHPDISIEIVDYPQGDRDAIDIYESAERITYELV